MHAINAHIADLIERLGRITQAALFAEGLLPVQWQALRHLAKANRFSRTPSALALGLGATTATVSQAVIALERHGLIAWLENPSDRRSISLELTEAGRDLVARDPMQLVDEALSATSEDSRTQLAALLREVLARLIEVRGGRPFGHCGSCRFFVPEGAIGQDGGPHLCGLIGLPLAEDERLYLCGTQEPDEAPA